MIYRPTRQNPLSTPLMRGFAGKAIELLSMDTLYPWRKRSVNQMCYSKDGFGIAMCVSGVDKSEVPPF